MEENRPTGPVSRRSVLGALVASAGATVAGPLLVPSSASAGVPLSTGSAAALPRYLDPTAPLSERVDAILALMTDEQRLACFTGVPATTLSDGYQLGAIGSGGVEGLHGSGEVANATMFPQAVGLGSTWDTELIEKVGQVVGYETRARDASRLRAWAPVADVRANPLAGRFEEGYGEDPFLCGVMGTAYAFGIKGRDPLYILAKPEMKHFFAYNHEWNRARSSSSMSIRAMYEFNVVSYRMPIEAGAVLGAMTAYNLINGVPANVHPILRTVREEWAPGNFMFVSDAWDEFNLYATKGAPYVYPLVRPANADVSYAAGLSPDPTDDAMNRNTTAALLLRSGMTNFSDGNGAGFDAATAARGAVRLGLLGVSTAQVDRVVRDWLAYKIRTGALDGTANPYNSTVIPPNPTPQDLQSSKDLALLAAREQIVLLRNDHNVLPLESRAHRIAVIGPLADVNLRDYYSPRPADDQRVTPLQGIAAKIGADRVTSDNGTDIVAWRSVQYGTFVSAGTGSAPMTANYVASSAPVAGGFPLGDGTHVGPAQAFQIYDWGYDQHLFRSVATGSYVNTDQAIVNNATQLRTSQATMADTGAQWNTNENFHYPRHADGTRSIYGVDYIEDDQFYRRYTTGRYVQAGSDAQHTLAPTLDYAAFTAGDETVRKPAKFTEYRLSSGTARAVAAAKDADYAVVVIGNEVVINARESKDRPGLALSPQHAALVRAVAAARPARTIVVIVSSYPYAVKEIQDNPHVAAIVHTSHAGQAAGTALADVLFGDYAPAGRLSATWLVDESSLPKMGPDADGHDPEYTVDMLEYDQISAGLTYRYSAAPHVYPFGHGLTYTEFRYHDLAIPRSGDATRPFEVTFQLTNSGKRSSDEVVQVYARCRDSAYGDRVPRRQLIGFQRVKALAPGETRRLSLRVDPQDMFVWDVISQGPVVETGWYDLMVGASSTDIRLSAKIHLTGHTIGSLDLTPARNAWEYYTIGHGVSHWEVSKTRTLSGQGGYHSVASRRDGDHIGFTRVQVDNLSGIELRVATTAAGWAGIRHPAIDVRLDRPTGRLLGSVRFEPTGGLQDFTAVRAALNGHGVHGTHDLYLVFRGAGVYLDTVQLLRQPV